MQSSFILISTRLKQNLIVFSFPVILDFVWSHCGVKYEELHCSACVSYAEASEVLLEFQAFQLIDKLGEEGQALWGKYREHRMEEQFGRKAVLTVPCSSH